MGVGNCREWGVRLYGCWLVLWDGWYPGGGLLIWEVLGWGCMGFGTNGGFTPGYAPEREDCGWGGSPRLAAGVWLGAGTLGSSGICAWLGAGAGGLWKWFGAGAVGLWR